MAPVKLERANTLANRVREFMEVEKGHLAPRGKPALITELKKLELFFARKEFNRETLMEFFKWLKKNYTHSGYYRGVSINREFVRWLYRMRYISEPMHEFFPRVNAPPPGEITLITEEQYRKFVDCYRHSPYGWAMVLAYHTAFRLGDVCSLRWSEVNLKTQFITKVLNKTRRIRLAAEVPILSGSDLYDWLARMEADKDDPEFVSPELWRRYQSHAGLPSDLSKALRSVGINTTFHSLRKTFESRLANSGMNLALAAKITGRTDPRSLMRYIKPDKNVVMQGVAKALELPDGSLVPHSSVPENKSLIPVAPLNHSGESDGTESQKELPASWLV